MTVTAPQLVGRAAELGLLDDLLAGVTRGAAGTVEIAGEPGIGKTRLLSELATRADARGLLVLSGSAAELESDLPFWVFVDALDDYVHGLEAGRLDALDAGARAELGHVLPAFASGSTTPTVERFRVHRAVRDLLEVLAGQKPLVLVLDDLHWADSGSIDLLGALLRRPPERVLIAFAVRPRQLPERLTGALERASRAGALTRVQVEHLSAGEARELLGGSLSPRVYEDSGGNPFYLQQLARFPGRGAAAALADELALVPAPARRVLEGAAVAGDPFEPELAAAATGVSEPEALDALDELLASDLIRPTDVPRRFRFRHPLIRSAVYEAASAAWRLGAHERCAAALGAQGAPAAARAHHVEHAARHGDAEAIAILREAGATVAQRTPAGAARWYAAAVRLLPATAPVRERIELLLALASALAAAARFTDARAALEECERILPAEAIDTRSDVVNAAALLDGLTGRHAAARARLERAAATAGSLTPARAVGLLVHLGANAVYRMRYEDARAWGERAYRIASESGGPELRAMAAAMLALACAMGGAIEEARRRRDEAAGILDALSDAALAPLVSSLNMLASTELYLGGFAAGEARAARALGVARAAGQATLFPTFAPIKGWLLFTRGRLDEAAELLDGAVEAARLTGSSHALAWVLFTRAPIALFRGHVDAALADGEEGMALSDQLDRDSIVGTWCHLTYALVVADVGEPERAIQLLTARVGGPDLPRVAGIWRAYYLDRFIPAWLALDRRAEAEAAAAAGAAVAAATGLPFAAAVAERARARLALAAGDARTASQDALAAAATMDSLGAPVEAALTRTLAGSALSAAGEADRAGAELERAATALEACGARRYRDAAERELGTLGRRRHRRTQPGRRDGTGVDSLTARELEVARLIVDRRTNAEIAGTLFLSPKTVETHIRNLFHKLDVSSRAEVARAVERAES